MMMYSGAEGYSRSLRYFDCVHILLVSFPHESGVCSNFFFDVVREGG